MTLRPSKGSAAVLGVLGVLGELVTMRMLGRTCVSARHTFLMIRRCPSALAQELRRRVDAPMLRLAGVDLQYRRFGEHPRSSGACAGRRFLSDGKGPAADRRRGGRDLGDTRAVEASLERAL